jgi:peptidoglycan/LPS O-acetylase OafA/YrhL
MQADLIALAVLYVACGVVLYITGGFQSLGIFLLALPLLVLAPLFLYTAHCEACAYAFWAAPIVWTFVAVCVAGARQQNEIVSNITPSQTPSDAESIAQEKPRG